MIMDSMTCLWPSLSGLGLSNELATRRRGGIGGSDANIILSGNPERVLALWREKRGESESEDLNGVLPVMLGCWTEAFNRQWYAKQTGYEVSQAGSLWTCDTHRWRMATLDGVVEQKHAVFEAKHVSAFAKPDDVLTRYMPQLQHNMVVTGMERAILSVIFGNHKWEAYEIASDWLYQEELLAAEQHFWRCVASGDPPVAIEPPAPPRPIHYRELCLDGSNVWASLAVDWRDNGEAARRHAAATKGLKDMVPDDVNRAFGHGIEARRSKSGAVSIREAAR
jgi:hypothetical protein